MLRLWLAMGVGVACLMLSGLVASLARAQATADPAAVITAYEMARNRRDIDAALSYFADNATINQRNTSVSGKEDIRKFLDGASTRSRFVVVSDRRTSGNRVTWTERSGGQAPATPPQASPGFSAALVTTPTFTVTVEAVVQDGKIVSLAYMATNQPMRTDQSLDGRAQLPASVGLAAVLVVLLSFLMIASTGLGRSRSGASTSTLRGRLVADLQGWSAARQ